ncbi:MAG TPA: hypothetical protein VE619_06395, partial [Nitrososphaeraceae archaeon]|nr:hypothetical protein [Nitrososphaeraceae archaeon]
MESHNPVNGKLLKFSFISNEKLLEILIACSVIIVCFLTALVLLARDQNALLYYGDAVSHLVISRTVLDSIQPGPLQLGGVWLPMTHVMLMPFVINDLLFDTGLAGTIVSSLCTAATCILLYRITKLQLDSMLAAVLAIVLFLSNSSVIYLSIVPMMEAPFIMFFVLCVYYIQKLYYRYYVMALLRNNLSGSNFNSNSSSINNNTGNLYKTAIKCGLAISAATLTRYEAWSIPLVFTVVIVSCYMHITRKEKNYYCYKKNQKIFLAIAILISFLGIAFWISWNIVYFKDPLYFALGPYSAQAQSKIYSKYFHSDAFVIFSTLLAAAKSVYGIPVLLISVVSAIIYIVSVAYIYDFRIRLTQYNNAKRSIIFYALTSAVLFSPTLSIYVSMIQGSGVIYPIKDDGWYNGRFLVFLAPLLAFFSVSIVAWVSRIWESKSFTIVPTAAMVIVVVIPYGLIVVRQPLSIGEAIAMSDEYSLLPYVKAFQFSFAAGEVLGKLYHGGNVV